MTRKLFLCPFFGPLPPWFDQYHANIELLKPMGYEWHITTNLPLFRQRVGDILHINPPIVYGEAKVHDLRPALGLLFQEELRNYDFWGHTDFDCCYGRVYQFLSRALLAQYDILSNHHNYICGPWTLYRNDPYINRLFMVCDWRRNMSEPATTGWAEDLHLGGFSHHINAQHEAGKIRRLYFMHQAKNPWDCSNVRMEAGRLMDGDTEIMMAHFRTSKEWPKGVRFE